MGLLVFEQRSRARDELIVRARMFSELIVRARMLRPHIGSRLVSAPLTFGVHCRTLSGEERYGRMIANPAFSPESMAGSSEARSIEVLSALLGGAADRRWGFGASYRSKNRWSGQAFSITERHHV